MAVSPNTNFVSGAILTAQQQNNFPRGLMGYVVRTAGNVALNTVTADVTGATLTFTAEANRGYMVSFNGTTNKVTAGYISIQFTDASNNLIYDTLQDSGNGDFGSLSVNHLLTTLTAGSTTIKVRASVEVGT
jgi:hypothetical protein